MTKKSPSDKTLILLLVNVIVCSMVCVCDTGFAAYPEVQLFWFIA